MLLAKRNKNFEINYCEYVSCVIYSLKNFAVIMQLNLTPANKRKGQFKIISECCRTDGATCLYSAGCTGAEILLK